MSKKEIFKVESNDLDIKGTFEKMKIVIGSHYYINLTMEDNKPFFEIGATHHGVKFDASKINGELEKVINELRKLYEDNITD